LRGRLLRKSRPWYETLLHHYLYWFGRRTTLVFGSAIAAIIALLVMVPVQLNALASAEITPINPIPITAPMDGVIKEILVKPNQIVKSDETLFVLDDTSLRNRLSVAQKSLEINRADAQRAINKAFTDDSARAELQVLNSRVREKRAEVEYLTELMDRLSVDAPQGGVAIFTSADDWVGKPVQTGERIMTVADPSLIKVTIFVAPADVVDLEPGAEVTLFLNTDPLNPLSARVTRSSYEPQQQKDGTLAYVVQADLLGGHGFPRIGMRGTAKIFAEPVSLGYYLFRKPLAYLRQTIGF
jgi:multidrug resistance efflux pump